ncbi:P-loop containing nucleoside triphosphate hydrolase protein [Phlegmacium glaucopus]|nr:P-loop containing nucleoside triphosphate hydrolase protein [Phlegmacium glaucopus]
MAPTTKSQSQTTRQKPKAAATLRARTVKLDAASGGSPLSLKRLDPLTAFSRGLTPTLVPSATTSLAASSPQNQKEKGKAKEKSRVSSTLNTPDDVDDQLWVDKYEPTTEAELAVHVRKVEDVRRWLTEAFDGGPLGKLKRYRRILALTGPAGTGKTSTIRVLARELGFEIMEWRNAVGEASSSIYDESASLPSTSTGFHPEFDQNYEGIFTRFEAFLTRASTCQNIFTNVDTQLSQSTTATKSTPRRHIILLEDLPNILHARTQAQFHEALNSLVASAPANPAVPLVIIISDAGMRGEATDERIAGGSGRNKMQIVDVRTVLSKDLLGGPYVTEIGFNPIAPTLLRKAVQALLKTHFASSSSASTIAPSKEVIDIIVESANGDIRNAIMALQFSCIAHKPSQKKKKHMGNTSREQSLALFHLLGKVLYNKRKDHPPNPSASAKDLQKERELDALLKDPLKLPLHLQHHERRTSRVDVDMLYADSPIDSSLFSLYIHQNYTQFCNDIEESEGVADWLSWVDSSGGEAWYQANPHQFHLITLGTLHSLPSPVIRRSQKTCKPEFFTFLQKEKDSWDAVRVIKDWIVESELAKDMTGWRVGGWSKIDVVLELGGILKAKDAVQSPASSSFKPPPVHKLFSEMKFIRGGSSVNAQQLDEADIVENGQHFDEDESLGIDTHPMMTKDQQQQGGWLDTDDIEEFD